jgi:hypothetical protein
MHLELPPPPEDAVLMFVDLPARWDTGWYVGLASGGYKWDGVIGRFENLAFFPAYPLLLAAVARATGAVSQSAWNWTGVSLSTFLFALALVALWHMARTFMDDRRATWSVGFCASYPFAIFFGLPYTESLFLLGLVTTVLAYERRWFGVATALGVVVGLTRPNGMMLVPALLILGMTQVRRAARNGQPINASLLAASATAALAPLLGVAVYSAFVYGLTGHPFTWALVQEGWGRPAMNPVVALWSPLASMLARPLATLHDAPHDVMNAVAGVFALAAVVPVTRCLGLAHGVLVLEGVAIPLTFGGVPSLGRYTAVLFPIHVWLAASIPARALPWTLGAFVAFQGVAAAMFFTWRSLY